MDGDSKEDGTKPRRRNTRQTSQTGLYVNTRSRLKRTRNLSEDDGVSRVVNGSKESKSLEEEDEYGESPEKKQKIGEEEDINEKGDRFNLVEMDVGENQDEEMNSDEEVETDNDHAEAHPVRNPESDMVLERRKSIHETSVDPEMHKQSRLNLRPIRTTQGLSETEEKIPVVLLKRSYLDGNAVDQETHKFNKAKTTNQGPSKQQESVRILRSKIKDQHPVMLKVASPFGNWNSSSAFSNQKLNINQTSNYSTSNQIGHHKNPENLFSQKQVISKASPVSPPREKKFSQKSFISKSSPVSPSKGWLWSICKALIWCLMLTVLLIFGYWVYHKYFCSNLSQTDMVHSETLKSFDVDLVALQAVFPSQRSELWKRSGIHLKRHLQTVNPTEPVSVILTAGPQAEQTLGCLARSLATVFSAFHNASILEIDGTTKKALESDQVKLQIDDALKNAFEGDKPAVVVHHFEELPPGSTLIFYRYCDHENAAYKKVFLVFTVMLSEDKIDSSSSLNQVEEMVLDHVKQRFIASEKSAMFNQMDLDKLSGLWSRISHVILPVAAEQNIEQKGCKD